MAAIDFPNSPSLNDTFTSGSKTWTWNGSVWNTVTTAVGATGPIGPRGLDNIVTASSAPADTDVLWVDTSEAGNAVLPLAGTTGQVLSKVDGADYNTEWTPLNVAAISDLTATATELNYVDGVTSSIQDQFDSPVATFITDATTARTLTSADAGKTIRFTSGSATVVTVNASTDLPVGTRVDIIADGVGALTVTASTATVAAAEVATTSGSFTIGAQYSAATLLCVATDEYRLIGNVAVV